MKIRLFILTITFLLLTNCSGEKEVAQRRNFMMPEKTDLKRNDKYKGPSKKKTYKVTKKKKKNTKKY